MYFNVPTGRNKRKFINKQALKNDIASTAFWLVLLCFFGYCLYA